jgi:hypothetical protein
MSVRPVRIRLTRPGRVSVIPIHHPSAKGGREMERNRSIRTAVAACVLSLALSATSPARTLYVDDHAPADFRTIQAAIDDANNGDTIVVAPGRYTGPGNRDVDFKGKAVTVRSDGGARTCIVDCGGTKDDPHRGFILRRPGKGTAVLDGFTVTNGYAEYGGGGLQMERGCVVRNCVVTGNYVERGVGGGISLSGGTVVNCVITNNLAGREGVRASGGGIGAGSGRWNVVDPLIINCTIVGNKATDKGGGIACFYNGIAGMENCIVVGNRASTASQIWAYDEMKEPVAMKLRARNCCIQSDSCADIWQRSCAQSSLGGSTLTVEEAIYTDDPGFVDPAQGDFRLRPDSPCMDRGTVATSVGLPDTDLMGNPRVADGDRDGAARPDLGAYEVPVPDEPYLWASALNLRFTPPAEGLAPEPQTLTVRNLGAKASHWVARSDCDWLTLTPDGGSSDEGPVRMMVSVDTRGLEGGSYTCNITISDAYASNSPLTIPVTLSARFRHVPDEYATIQEAIDAADPHDTIVVADGVYYGPDNEGITCRGKPLTIRSANGPEGCRIQRSAGTYAQTFAFVFDRRDRHCIVDGFTIVGCDPAIRCEGSSPLAIRNCHIVGGKNLSGITVRLSDVTMEDCTLADCRLGLNGRWSSIQVFRCAFRNNDTAVICEEACALQLDGCDVSDSWAKAIDFSFCNELRMTDCSICGTQARGTSSWAIGCSNTFSVVVESCLISGNRLGGLLLSSCQDVTIRDTILSGNGAYGVGSLSNLAIRNCTFVGNKGAGLFYYGRGGDEQHLLGQCAGPDNRQHGFLGRNLQQYSGRLGRYRQYRH